MKHNEFYAALLLDWARSIEEHGLSFEEWLEKMPRVNRLEVANAA